MEEFKNSKSAGIYDVDCTAEGQALCEMVGVKGYPTIKHGDPSKMDELQDYDGGRDFEDLKKFAEEKLGPVCGPKSLEACDSTEKGIIEAAMAKTLKELTAEIAKFDKDFAGQRKVFQKKKRKFDEKYQEFKQELKDHKSDRTSHGKAKAKLEANAKAAKAEKDKFAKQDKKMQDMIAKFNKREEVIEAEKAIVDKEEDDLNAATTASGLKFMKLVKATKSKDEL